VKQPIYFLFFLLATFFTIGCEDSDTDPVEKTFGYATITERVGCISQEYDKEYNADLTVHNDEDVKIEYVWIYKHYKGALGESERVLDGTRKVDLASISPYYISFNFQTSDLKSDLFVATGSLPQSDTELSLGDVFILSYDYHYTDGSVVRSSEETIVEFVPRLDGLFTTEESMFHVICAYPVFDDIVVRVRAVSLHGYIVEAIGGWTIEEDPGNWFYFYVGDDNMVHIPLEYEGETQTAWGEDPIFSPESHPEHFGNSPNIPNQVYNDDGTYRIRLNFGYYRESGFREFEQILRKNED